MVAEYSWSELFSWTSPLPYSIAAGAATILAIIIGYIYHSRMKAQLQKEIDKINRETAKLKKYSRESEENKDEKTADPFDEKVAEKQEEEIVTPGAEELRDPLTYHNHIPSRIKQIQQKTQWKKIEEEMDAEQKEKEREVKRKQMEAIFNLMKDQDDKFGIRSEDDLTDQMRLYVN